jgi:hypothetical protein
MTQEKRELCAFVVGCIATMIFIAAIVTMFILLFLMLLAAIPGETSPIFNARAVSMTIVAQFIAAALMWLAKKIDPNLF